jgi:hypothetical protein
MKTSVVYVVVAIVIVIGVVMWVMNKPAQAPQPPAPVSATTDKGLTGTVAVPAPGTQASGTSATPTPAVASAAKAAAAAPAMATDAAKWAEGMTAMGTIANAIRQYYIEVGPKGKIPQSINSLGLTPEDVDGKYFGPADFTITVASMDPLTFTVMCTPGSKPDAPKQPAKRTLSSDGKWTAE